MDISDFGKMLRDVESDLVHAMNNLTDGRGEDGAAKLQPQLITIEVHIDTALQLVQKIQRDAQEKEDRDVQEGDWR